MFRKSWNDLEGNSRSLGMVLFEYRYIYRDILWHILTTLNLTLIPEPKASSPKPPNLMCKPWSPNRYRKLWFVRHKTHRIWTVWKLLFSSYIQYWSERRTDRLTDSRKGFHYGAGHNWTAITRASQLISYNAISGSHWQKSVCFLYICLM